MWLQYGELHCHSWSPSGQRCLCTGRGPITKGLLLFLTTIASFVVILLLLAVAALRAEATHATQLEGQLVALLAGEFGLSAHFRRFFLNPPKRTCFFGWMRWIVFMASFAKPVVRRIARRRALGLVTRILRCRRKPPPTPRDMRARPAAAGLPILEPITPAPAPAMP